MDRFVIRNPSPSTSTAAPSLSGRSRMIQTTIESLKCVVVVDDILHHKSRLQLSTSSKQEKIQSLTELGKKIPPRHIMMSTKIGRVINKLRNSEDEDISKAARKVYIMWKSHFIDHTDRPLIEVKCDLKTEKLRKSGRNLLAGALATELQQGDKLAEAIERETFQENKRHISNGYRRTIRHLVFTLRNDDELKHKVISGEVTLSDFVKENKKS